MEPLDAYSSPADITDDAEDPVMLAFLHFIAKDMLDHPENIAPLDVAQMDRIASLVAGVETD
jgi:antitoxin PrlF